MPREILLRMAIGLILVCLFASAMASNEAQATPGSAPAAQSFVGQAGPPASDLALWYRQPAVDWEKEALPIGNGAIGGMVFGGVNQERIQFNEKSLWAGGPGEWSSYRGGNWATQDLAPLARVRSLLEQKKYTEANQAANDLMNDPRAFGAYQPFGDLFLDFPAATTVSNYRRELDLRESMARVSYTVDSITYTREYFASYPDKAMVLRLTASQASKLTFTVRVTTPHSSPTITASNGRLQLSGRLANNGMAYESQIQVKNEGGTLTTNSNNIRVSGATAVTILLSAGTDYIHSYPTYKGTHPHTRVTSDLDAVAAKSYSQMRAAHVADYQALFNRVNLNLGQTKPTIPTDQLRSGYTGTNRYLEVLYFQYGRYLLISSSRIGALPANLQGIWNNSTTPPWSADYHVNINLQMNYWPAEVTNLSETVPPLIDFVDKLRPRGRETANIHFGAGGWTVHNQTNVFDYTGPRMHFTSFYFPEAAAWLCQHLWEHYSFTGDTTYLSTTAYPIMKEAAQFWLDFLIVDKDDGKLVASPSFSPEHGNFSVGASMSQQIIWDLLSNTIEASQVLGVDATFRQTLIDTRNRLDPGLRIGSWGQLQEWKPDWDSQTDTHRHVSHLFALHPGRQISPLTTPNYTNAAKVSLTARGDGGTGWSKAWKINFWARLLDGNHAHLMLQQLLKESTLSNLFDTHPPFQIDGNFGAAAGMAEMVLQSHMGLIHLLPALPNAWATGSVQGLRTRGAFQVDIKWSNKLPSEVLIRSDKGNVAKLKSPLFTGAFTLIRTSDGASVSYTRSGDTITFDTAAGTTYKITSGGGDGSAYPSGTPWAVPGTIQAENFNTGGQNTAYNDTDTTNNGGQYRTSEAVDIQATTDTGGGFNVGWTRAGEWLKYTVNVASSGSYTFNARVATTLTGASFHAEIDGVNVTGPISVPNTGGNQTWTTVGKTGINLTAGQHVLRIVFDTAGAGSTAVGNFNFFSFSAANPGTTVEAESCTLSQAVVASNHTGFTGTGFVDYNNVTGSYVECTVSAAAAGSATVTFRYANGTTTNRPMSIAVNGTVVSSNLAFNGTGAWTTWANQSITANLVAGNNTIRATATTVNGGPNLDRITVQ